MKSVRAYGLPLVCLLILFLSVPAVSQAATLVARSASWRYVKGYQEPSDPRSEWRSLQFDDSAWNSGRLPAGYGEAGLNLTLSDMPGNYSSFFLRKLFFVSSLDADTRLRVAVDYDDGFILWINGERVLERNEPDGTPLCGSLASDSHESGEYESFDLPDPEDYLETGQNVIAVQVFNRTIGSSDCKIDVELVSFKRVQDTEFSHDRGFYTAPFAVTIATDTPGATIRYTTDGSAPGPAHGTVGGQAAVVPISTTTCLRAVALKAGFDPSDVDTQTYIFLEAVLDQGDMPMRSNWTVYGDSPAKRNTEMDPGMIGAGKTYTRQQVLDALRAIPTLSLVMDPDDLFDSARGLYVNWAAHGGGETWERPVSVELLHPDGSKGFQEDCGIRAQGQVTEGQHGMFTKRSLQLFFRRQYGAAKLETDLFENAPLEADSAVDRFDKIQLRAGSNDVYPSLGDKGTYLKDAWARNTQIAMSGIGVHSTYAHLYINGYYWGLYNPSERMDAACTAEHMGGEEEDWFALKYNETIAGDSARWDYLGTIITRDLSVAANYAEAKAYIDVARFCEYMLVNWFVDNSTDWEWYGGNRNEPPGPFMYFVFDGDEYFENSHDGSKIVVPANRMGNTFTALFANDDFKLVFADALYRTGFNGGALDRASATLRVGALRDFLAQAVIGESCRWGDHWEDERPGETWTTSDWTADVGDMLARMDRPASDSSSASAARLLLLARGYTIGGAPLYPSLDPPAFHQHGGAIASGFRLTLSNPNGSGAVYYTLDGSDPRAAGGGIAAGAIPYAGPPTLARTTHVIARVYKSRGTWSAAHTATFNHTSQHGRIRITELMYNPLGGSDYEFIEIKNTGTSTRGLSRMRLKGLAYTFAPGTELAAGAMAVLVANPSVFTNRYPAVAGRVALFDTFGARLSNGGERIALLDSDGLTVTAVDYNDKHPWPEKADGDGCSLVPVDENGDANDPANWRASSLIGGSPGYDDGEPFEIVVNEVLTHTDPPQQDAVELYNAGSTTVDIGGWYLSDTDDDYRKFAVPAGTLLPPGGYAVFDEDDFNAPPTDPDSFAFSSLGDQAYLTRWDGQDNLLYLAEARFGAAATGAAFGRYVKSDGDADYVAQTVPDTLGSANAPPEVGPVVINEIMYHPRPAGLEFLELVNISAAAVNLYDAAYPQNRWELDGAVEYTFPAGTVLQPGERVLVVPTNAAAFRAVYPGVPSSVRLFGPYVGALANGGESVKLWRPDPPEGSAVPRILVDRVQYNDNSPWPENADGDGPSLERQASEAYGNDAVNWAASAAAGGTPGAANSGVLVPQTAGWRFQDKGVDLGTAWRARAFDDTAWPHGNAPLGYGDPAVDTEVSDGGNPDNRHITTYFRRRFTLGVDPADLAELTLYANYDDGFVAYLNGQEVARKSMPTGTVSFGTLASGHSALGFERIDLTAQKGRLAKGVNVLALELHQASPASSDLFIDVELSAGAGAPIEPPAAPSEAAAAALSSSEITLTWRDNASNEEQYTIRRGTDPALLSDTFTAPADATRYADAGLQPDTTYYYKVRAENAGGMSLYTAVVSAKTQPEGPSTIVEARVAASDDDAEEKVGTGAVETASSDLELVEESALQLVGIRFRDLSIPRGATILNAWVQFKVDETTTAATALTIRGQASDNAAAFSAATGNVSGRPATSAAAAWDPPAWSTVGQTGSAQRTADLAAVIQEIVSRPGWAPGNALALLIGGSGKRVAESYDGDSAGAPLLHVEYGTTPAEQVVDVRVSGSSDDAEQNASTGAVYLDSSDLELVRDSAAQVVGLRFRDVGIPQGASILEAYVQFKVDEVSSEGTALTIRGQAADSAATFTTAAGDIGARPTTTASVAWSPAAWSSVGAAGSAQRTPDLAAVVQEIVGRAGWSSGNALALLISGSGKRVAEAYDGDSAGAPLLHVRYSSEPPTNGTDTIVAEVRVGAGTDDAEENVSTRGVSLDSTDLELTRDASEQLVGLRFANVPVPRGATIAKAHVRFKTDETTGEPTALTIRGQDSDNAGAFQAGTGNISSRPLTTASASWAPPAWSTVGESGPAQQTPDISAVVQAIVNRAGWSSGNAMALVVAGTGKRVAESREGDAAGAALLHIEYTPTESTVLDARVNSASDDAEERLSDGSVGLGSSDLELIHEGGSTGYDQLVGVRFRNVAIPPGAAITQAYLQFKVDEVSAGSAALAVRGQAADNAAAFAAVNGNISGRPVTSASVAWSPPDWPTVGAAGAAQRTPDLAPVIQEIVNRSGWASGNALVLLVSGSGKRVAEAYEGDSAGAALLHVEYGGSVPPPPPPPPPPPVSEFAAYNDLAWFAGQPAVNITTFTTTTGYPAGVPAGYLKDYATGAATPVQLAVAGGSGVYETQGAHPATGTDAYAVFNGIVSGAGTISYGTEDLTLTFTGLDAAKRYELVLYCDRNGASYVGDSSRYHVGILSGADSFQNTSSLGTTLYTTSVDEDTTSYNAGYNRPYGYVTRFTQIDPGADGRIVLTVKRNSTLKYYSYANAVMLKTVDPAAPPPASEFAAYNDLAWFAGQPAANITMFTTTTGYPAGVPAGYLKDYA
ncbi:MAG: lamin tail domain-containing protein, partial [Kiritimatiellae bacterium]|nr:lamin tail domain-containing protein [Kiritimatiellia bacterium]